MINMRDRRVFFCAVFLAALTAPSAAYSQTGTRAITRPSADITLSYVQPGRIAKVHFKEGDTVKAGQVLIQQDDTAEQVQLAQLRAQSENTTQVSAAKASLAQKKVDLEKLEKAAASNAATVLEVEHARLEVRIAELSLELAKFEHEQAARKYEEQRIRVENMRIKSPIDGRVEKVDVEIGESANALEAVIQVVRIDPLWIDVPVPLAEAIGLKNGMVARIQFPGAEPKVEEGRVIFVAAVADAASGTLRVRIEVPNESHRPAGEHVLVTFRDRGS